jgi:hypothetical protein
VEQSTKPPVRDSYQYTQRLGETMDDFIDRIDTNDCEIFYALAPQLPTVHLKVPLDIHVDVGCAWNEISRDKEQANRPPACKRVLLR